MPRRSVSPDSVTLRSLMKVLMRTHRRRRHRWYVCSTGLYPPRVASTAYSHPARMQQTKTEVSILRRKEGLRLYVFNDPFYLFNKMV